MAMQGITTLSQILAPMHPSRHPGWSPKAPLLWRLRSSVGVLRAIWRYGRLTKESSGVRLRRQLAGMLKLTIRHGYRPAQDYYRYRMYHIPDAADVFLSSGLYFELRETLYNKLALNPLRLSDKRVFYRACETVGLPIPETIADFEAGSMRWWNTARLPACDLFSKEAASMCGAGAECWSYLGESHWRNSGSAVFSESQLIRSLSDLSNRAPMILQRKLETSDSLLDLATSGLCTVRVVTVRDVSGRAPELLLATFRMPTGGGVADNFAAGGIACPVDLATGVLGSAVQKSLALAHIDIPAHPDTGGEIAGRVLPLWHDVLDLALKAHRQFSEFPSVGWDIAITPTGAKLIEGNYNWDVVLSQQPGCRPLGGTKYVDHIMKWFEFAESK